MTARYLVKNMVDNAGVQCWIQLVEQQEDWGDCFASKVRDFFIYSRLNDTVIVHRFVGKERSIPESFGIKLDVPMPEQSFKGYSKVVGHDNRSEPDLGFEVNKGHTLLINLP